jgi:hypothetical protein
MKDENQRQDGMEEKFDLVRQVETEAIKIVLGEEYVIKEGDPIVVAFQRDDDREEYMIGRSLQDILQDILDFTAGGKRFGEVDYKSYRVMSVKEADDMDLGYLSRGLLAIFSSSQKTFFLGKPGVGRKSFEKYLHDKLRQGEPIDPVDLCKRYGTA